MIFFVLVGIRLREEPRRYTIHGAYKQPLPSSGLLAFANKFCPGGERNRVSLFADLIDVLSALHVNNTLLGDVERHSAGEQSSPVESNDLAWIQNDVGDFDLLSSGKIYPVYRKLFRLFDRVFFSKMTASKQFLTLLLLMFSELL